VSLWEIVALAIGIVLGGALGGLSKLRRREQPKTRTTLHSPGVQPAIAPPRIIERQEALHDEHATIAHEDAVKQADEAKPKGDIKGAVDELF